MSDGKTVADVMIGIFEYPHVPYWVTIRQTVKVVRASFLGAKKYPDPLAILVFDEKYNLMGVLTLRHILKGLEPRFLKAPPDSIQLAEEDESALTLIWDTLFKTESKELSERQVSEVMTPAKYFVEPSDPVTKAAYLMLHHDLLLLPVLENKRKLVGLVRMIEIFDTISDAVIKE